MSFVSTLLRVVLCLALAPNGVSLAHAGPHMEHSAPAVAAAGSAPVEADGSDGMPCHGTNQAGEYLPASEQLEQDGGGEPAIPDCCKSACKCACMQHATPPVAVAALSAQLAHESTVQRGAVAHAPPAVVRLNRPPIA